MFDRHNPADEAGNFVIVVFKVMFWLLVMAIPPLFKLIMWGIRELISLLLERDPTMPRAKAVLVTVAVWTGLALVLAVLALGSGGPPEVAAVITVVGALFGLATGGIVTRSWLPAEMIDSPMDSAEAMGINPEVMTPEYEDEELVWRVDRKEGVVLGYDD